MFDARFIASNMGFVIELPDLQAYRLDVNQTEQAVIPDTASSVNTVSRVARLGDRAVAAFLDFFIPAPLLFMFFTLQAIRLHVIDGDGSFSLNGGPAFLPMTAMFLGWMVYAIISEFKFDGTIGKHIMGIATRTDDRRPITLLQAVVRNFARVVDAIGLYLVGFLVALNSKQSQRIGDRLANTVVFELEKSDRMMGVLCGIAVFLTGILANTLAMHFGASQN